MLEIVESVKNLSDGMMANIRQRLEEGYGPDGPLDRYVAVAYDCSCPSRKVSTVAIFDRMSVDYAALVCNEGGGIVRCEMAPRYQIDLYGQACSDDILKAIRSRLSKVDREWSQNQNDIDVTYSAITSNYDSSEARITVLDRGLYARESHPRILIDQISQAFVKKFKQRMRNNYNWRNGQDRYIAYYAVLDYEGEKMVRLSLFDRHEIKNLRRVRNLVGRCRPQHYVQDIMTILLPGEPDYDEVKRAAIYYLGHINAKWRSDQRSDDPLPLPLIHYHANLALSANECEYRLAVKL